MTSSRSDGTLRERWRYWRDRGYPGVLGLHLAFVFPDGDPDSEGPQ